MDGALVMRGLYATLATVAAGSTLVIGDELLKGVIVVFFALLTWSLSRVVKNYDQRLEKVERGFEEHQKAVGKAVDYVRQRVHRAKSAPTEERRKWALELAQEFLDRWRMEGFPEGATNRAHEAEEESA